MGRDRDGHFVAVPPSQLACVRHRNLTFDEGADAILVDVDRGLRMMLKVVRGHSFAPLHRLWYRPREGGRGA